LRCAGWLSHIDGVAPIALLLQLQAMGCHGLPGLVFVL
jgi:hypothetical protein